MTTQAPAPAAIERRLELVAPPDRVWRALADEQELTAWFAQRASFRPQPGADGWLEWDAHGRFALRVEAADAPRYLAWRWARDPDTGVDAGPSTLIEMWIDEGRAGGTLLRIRESGFVRDEDRRGNVHGWLGMTGALSRYLADEPWQAGIHRTWPLRAAPDRVWRALTDPSELAAWWSGDAAIEVRPGYEGWWNWPSQGGRYAMRIEAVEPPYYLCWSWTTDAEVPLEAAAQVLRTEWMLARRDDGGTDLYLLETGFRGPRDHGLNDEGWEGDVVPALRRHLGEDGDPTATA